jgi:hypothetical protein
MEIVALDSNKVPQVPKEISQNESWFGIKDGIYFYNKDEPFYVFTNFYPAPITLDDKRWPSTEHYFQAQKFPNDPSLQESIRKQQSAREVFTIARKKKPQRRKDWNEIKVQIMIKAIRAKIEQYPDIKQTLLKTDKRIIVENAGANDSWWGAGHDGTGKNMLGRVLMYIRSELNGNEHKEILNTPIKHFKEKS